MVLGEKKQTNTIAAILTNKGDIRREGSAMAKRLLKIKAKSIKARVDSNNLQLLLRKRYLFNSSLDKLTFSRNSFWQVQ